MSGMYLLASILCLAVAGSLAESILEGNYNVTALCTSVKYGVQVGSLESCDYYYVCTPSGPVKTNCQAGYAYNYVTQTCSPEAQVNCYYGVENPCAGSTGDKWVPVAGTCNQWIYCKNGVNSGQGSCGALSFDPTSQNCTYAPCNTLPDSEINYCNVVPPGIYFGTTTDCRTYNYCYPNGKLASANCEFAFLVQQGGCGYNTGSNCDRVVTEAVPNSCDNAGDVEPNNSTCGSYYYCNGKNYVTMSCPIGQYFDTILEKCVARQQAVAAEGCNRCQYANTAFVNNVNYESCNTYYYCSNGVNGPVTNCPSGYYFNESEQGCASMSELGSYVTNNGACHGAQAPDTTTGAPSSDSTNSEQTELSTASDAPTKSTATTENSAGK
ncbi:peritrophin-48 [Drosophila virilis]|uniref:Chitin-binding type-2 domain-containing protein n=1 Tax=Drosophila virilis TaxID=7244 RepID=B4MDH5_DROVI|nr:peritrophin-48 [Drosophila virilis]EDW71236.1 uncharacterized protein Dvir_GJ16249 [Drosophila virilis]